MEQQIPENLRYTKEHEWAEFSDNVVTIGITDFAQSSMGDIVFLELPETGIDCSKEEAFGVIESIKSVSDLFCPVSGTVIEINEDLIDGPELLRNYVLKEVKRKGIKWTPVIKNSFRY